MDVGAGLMEAILWMFAAAVALLVVVSVWDAWAPALRARKQKEVTAKAVPELDFSGKRARQEAAEKEWIRGWFEALGADREEFVKQWADESQRRSLAVRLRVAEDLADREGRVGDLAAIRRMRREVTAYPEQGMSSGRMGRIEDYLGWVERDRARTLMEAGSRGTLGLDGVMDLAGRGVPLDRFRL